MRKILVGLPRAVLITAVVCGPLLASCRVVAEDDPEIDGKPLSQLIKQLRSENRGLQMRAAQALSAAPTNLHATVVPQVIPVLRSERENDKFVAAQILGVYGPMARAAVPDLLPMLEGTQFERNRAAAAKALGQTLKDAESGAEVEKVTQALARKFNEDYDKYSDVRREAVHALGMIGPAAKSCIPKLKRALTDGAGGNLVEDQMVRREGAWTCGRMGPLAAEYIDLLISMLNREGSSIPEIVEAIGHIGAVHGNVVPNIVNTLESADINTVAFNDFRAKSFIALQRIGAKAIGAFEFTKRFISNPPASGDEKGKQGVIEALKFLQALGAAAAPALPEIERLTQYPAQDELGKALREEATKTRSALKDRSKETGRP